MGLTLYNSTGYCSHVLKISTKPFFTLILCKCLSSRELCANHIVSQRAIVIYTSTNCLEGGKIAEGLLTFFCGRVNRLDLDVMKHRGCGHFGARKLWVRYLMICRGVIKLCLRFPSGMRQ